MSGRDDYLWDGSGEAPPEQAALERLLAPLRHDGRPLGQLPRQRSPRRGTAWPWLGLAAAGLLVGGLLTWGESPATVLQVQVGSPPQQLSGLTAIRRIELEGVGSIDVDPGTILSLEEFSAARARLQLDSGRIAVRILPPPQVTAGFFQVGTRAGECVDLGCRYEMAADLLGTVHVAVTEGQVEFRHRNRVVYVPAGAEYSVAAGGEPSLPLFRDAPLQVRQQVGLFLAAREQPPELRRDHARKLLAVCREGRDTLPVWHLLGDSDPWIRGFAEARLVELTGEPSPPDGKELHWDAAQWQTWLRDGAWSQAR